MTQNIFITGASGCVGHYVFHRLVSDPQYHLHLLIRDPKKLKYDPSSYPNVTVHRGDLSQIQDFKAVLESMDQVIHLAAAWGGGNTPFEVNVDYTLQLFQLLENSKCHRILYFSTASILDSKNQSQLLPEAGALGGDYIRSKYVVHEKLSSLKAYDRITTLYPTVIFGGDKDHPYSHVSSGIQQIRRWMNIIRFINVEGSLHFVHAYDIALVVKHVLDNGSPDKNLVLGNPNTTTEEIIKELSEHLGYKTPSFKINLSKPLIELIIKLFNIQLDPWDRYNIETRHLRFEVTNPEILGIPSKYSTLKGILSDYF